PSSSHDSPLRDRPPILSGGGSASIRSASASGAADDSDGSGSGDERKATGGGGVDRGSSNDSAGGAAATPAVGTPGSKPGKKKSGTGGGRANQQGEDTESSASSKRGRKRPRVVGDGSTEQSARDRRPRSRGTEGEEQEEEEEKKEKGDGKRGENGLEDEQRKERADSVDAAHFRRIALEVWDRVYRHKFAIIFRKAVNPKDAPGYEEIIKEPMDLSLIRERIMSGALLSLDDMSRDLRVMCNNAMVFNGKDDPYFDYSKELRTYANEVIEEARRPGFVTADPGFDSVVAGARTSRARQPDHASRGTSGGSSSRGRGGQKGGGGGGGGGGGSSGRRNSRESDSASVADDTGDESVKSGRRGG
ncbi:unnamed protein product, partial [Ectocarpus sp. 12 AP-2014]